VPVGADRMDVCGEVLTNRLRRLGEVTHLRLAKVTRAADN